MEILILLVTCLLIFGVFFWLLGKQWTGPYAIFCVPFLVVIFISLINSNNWNFKLDLYVFFAIALGIFSFLFGCYIVKISSEHRRLVALKNENLKISNKKLFLFVLFEIVLCIWHAHVIMNWGREHGFSSFSQIINENMMAAKFNGAYEPAHSPFILAVCLQFNYIAGYIFAYLIARRIIYKNKINIIILFIGFFTALITCFLDGSRGPMVELLIALILSFLVQYKIKKRKISRKIIVIVTSVIIIGIYSFFAILPILGRTESASLLDNITKYIGAQLYNLNYYVTNNYNHSTFFGANTFSSLYSDIYDFFGILNVNDNKVSLFFITANNHDMGNVFTCFFDFLADFGIVGAVLLPLLMGIISQSLYKKATTEELLNIHMVIYLYLACNLMFCFFGNRFFSNVINLKFIIKFMWITIFMKFVSNGKIFLFSKRGKDNGELNDYKAI